MKVTNFGPDGIPVALAGWSTGITSINSNATTADGGLSALNFVQRITSNGSNILLNPSVNFAAGSNIALSAASNTITITGLGGGGAASISAGSNSSDVSGLSSAGASTTLWSPYDHRHAGIATVTASSSNTLERPVLNLRPGAGIALSLTDTDGDGTFDTVTVVNTGTVQTGPAGPPGASGTSRAPLDSYTLDGTFGDDFTEASLNARWTRRNFTGSNETYQSGLGATCILITMTGRTGGDAYFQTAPAGDWTFMMSGFILNALLPFWSIVAVNSSGTGIGTFSAGSPNVIGLGTITTYTSYGGTFVAQDHPAVTPVMVAAAKYWQYLRKSGTTYYHAYGLSGEQWSTEVSLTSGVTVDRVGMMAHPYSYGTASGGTTASSMLVDVFNKIA